MATRPATHAAAPSPTTRRRLMLSRPKAARPLRPAMRKPHRSPRRTSLPPSPRAPPVCAHHPRVRLTPHTGAPQPQAQPQPEPQAQPEPEPQPQHALPPREPSARGAKSKRYSNRKGETAAPDTTAAATATTDAHVADVPAADNHVVDAPVVQAPVADVHVVDVPAAAADQPTLD